jgi:putative spermidine/putrescine transport system permease protein
MFFALDAGFRAIDVHTLTEASQSLGASWPTTLFKVILPNIRVAALAGSFLALAIVMGEFTIANLAQFHTFPIFLQYVNETQAYPAAAVTLMSFGITWAAMLSLLFIGRGRGARPTLIAGGR